MQANINGDNLMMPELKLQRISAVKSRKSTCLVLENQVDDVSESSTEPIKRRSKSKEKTKAPKAPKVKKSASPDKKRVTRSRTRSKSPGRPKATSPKSSRGAKLYIKKDLEPEKEPSPAPKEPTPIKTEPAKKRSLRSASNLSSTSDLSLKLDESFPNTQTSEQKIESISAMLNDSKSSLKLEEQPQVVVSCGLLKCNKSIILNILFVTFMLMALFSLINHLSINRDTIDVYLNSFKTSFAGLKAKFI